jgi:aryl-alcohol dehydrogenase-like predicted oxidoreductase
MNNGGFYELGEDRDSDKIISRVAEVAKAKGWPMSHVPLAWLNKRVVSPVIGFSSLERMEDALAGLKKELTAEEEQYLEELYKPQTVQGHA